MREFNQIDEYRLGRKFISFVSPVSQEDVKLCNWVTRLRFIFFAKLFSFLLPDSVATTTHPHLQPGFEVDEVEAKEMTQTISHFILNFVSEQRASSLTLVHK